MDAIVGGASRESSAGRVNWRQVGLFVGLTFGLTWLLNLVLYLTVGYGNQATAVALQFQMLLPALSAIFLGLFVFRRGEGGPGASTGRARAFFWFFLVFGALYAGLAVASLALAGQFVGDSPAGPVPMSAIVGGVAQLLMLVGLGIVVGLRLARGRESFARAGLAFGKAHYWLIFGLGFVLFYVVQTALNAAFGLGQPADTAAIAALSGMDATTFLIVGGIQTVMVSPFLGLLIAFGEEYGWRGYLQGELVKLGRVRGIFLVGIIWGVWHAPIILMGHNYPGQPVAGVFLMTVYCILLAFVLGYVILKTGSVWLAAFLHAVNNQVFSFLVLVVYAPSDVIFSFGAGIYGLATLAVVVALLLRDPIWRKQS